MVFVRMMKLIVSISTLLLVAVAGQGLALAMSVPGINGIPEVPGDNFCFRPFFAGGKETGAVVGLCSLEDWVIPLAVNSGSKTISVAGLNYSGVYGLLNCDVIATNQNATQAAHAALVFPSTPFYSIQSATITVPANGSLSVTCRIPQNSVIVNVNYNQ
jgi:hypothetical protein